MLSVAGCAPREETPAPDVFLIVIDTARADRFSGWGNPRGTTPYLDTFAADAVVYTGARSPAPWTLPSHASMFTGLPAGLHGLHRLSGADGSSRETGSMSAGARARLLAGELREHGYRTIGISNNPWVSARTSLDEGFDRFHLVEAKLLSELRVRFEADTVEFWHHTGRARKSIALLEEILEAEGSPAFVFLNLIEPHFPYRATAGFRGCFGGDPERIGYRKGLEIELFAGRATVDPALLAPLYDEELRYVDAALGAFFRWLKQEGLYEESLIIVTSDHGEHLGEGGRYSHQLSIERELLDVPLLVRFPGGHRAGTLDSDPLVTTTDVYETILSTADPARAASPPEAWSRDLARAGSTPRSWMLSELYYSPRHLDRISSGMRSFDRAPHERVRRVVFTPESEVRWNGNDPPAGGEPALPAETLERISEYSRAVSELRIEYGEDILEDPELREELRALGYVD